MKRYSTFAYPAALISGLYLWHMVAQPFDIAALFKSHWPASITMIFGSLTAGGTPLGGGAVAFPVFTKILEADAVDARTFSLMIQAMGMSAATAFFIGSKTTIYWSVLARALPFSLLGLIIGLEFISATSTIIKFAFSCAALTAAIALFAKPSGNLNYVEISWPQAAVLGTISGCLAALIGTGADTLLYFFAVLILGVSPKQFIPTTIAFMAGTASMGALLTLQLAPPSEFAIKSWLVSAPIVMIGAPLGGYLMKRAPERPLLLLIKTLITIEACSTLWLVPLSTLPTAILSALILATIVSWVRVLLR